MKAGRWLRNRVGVSGCALAIACGGTSSGPEASPDAGLDAAGGTAAQGGSGGSPIRDSGTGGVAGEGGTGGTGGYVDPGCPDAAPNPPQLACDPWQQPSGCLEGEGCYPFVSYPSGVCDQETYGTLCFPAGVGQQGDRCSGEPCAPGYMCVVTGQGTQCVQICPLEGDDGCPPGLVCRPVDVEGFGGCF